MLPVVRTFISLPAGIADMAPVKFGIYTTIGCIPWTIALACAGYAVGANWQSIVNDFRGPTYIIAAVVVIGLAIAVWRSARLHRAGPARPAASGRMPPARTGTPGHPAEIQPERTRRQAVRPRWPGRTAS